MRIGIIGTSIWQQNMPLIECLTIDREQRTEILNGLKAKLGLSELVYLSTCNRVEFIYATTKENDSVQLLHRLLDFFFSDGKSISLFPNDFYHFSGKDAILHLFRTASSLESLVLGENQITGQIKSAYQEAVASGLSGPVLSRLINEALAISRKVKCQTSIGQGALSMASLASMELSDFLRPIKSPIIALVGAGPMQGKVAKYINRNLAADLIFVNRTVEKAVTLAEEYGGHAISLEEFRDHPDNVDAIISATAAIEPVFASDFANRLIENGKKVICIDLAVPRDFSADFNNREAIVMIDIPMLRLKSQGKLRRKFVDAAKANEIVRAGVNNYLSGRVEISLKPIFHNCYHESMEMASKALSDLFAKRITSLEEKDRDAVQKLVAKLIGHSTFGAIKKLSRELVNGNLDNGSGKLHSDYRDTV